MDVVQGRLENDPVFRYIDHKDGSRQIWAADKFEVDGILYNPYSKVGVDVSRSMIQVLPDAKDDTMYIDDDSPDESFEYHSKAEVCEYCWLVDAALSCYCGSTKAFS